VKKKIIQLRKRRRRKVRSYIEEDHGCSVANDGRIRRKLDKGVRLEKRVKSGKR